MSGSAEHCSALAGHFQAERCSALHSPGVCRRSAESQSAVSPITRYVNKSDNFALRLLCLLSVLLSAVTNPTHAQTNAKPTIQQLLDEAQTNRWPSVDELQIIPDVSELQIIDPQPVSTWPSVGVASLLLLVVCAGILICLIASRIRDGKIIISSSQARLIGCGLFMAGLLGCCVFAPWRDVDKSGPQRDATTSIVSAPLWSPPAAHPGHSISFDVSLFFVRLFIAGLVSGMAYWLTRSCCKSQMLELHPEAHPSATSPATNVPK